MYLEELIINTDLVHQIKLFLIIFDDILKSYGNELKITGPR
jgi:hypothetical protein